MTLSVSVGGGFGSNGHTLTVKDQRVFSFGNDERQQLGLGTTDQFVEFDDDEHEIEFEELPLEIETLRGRGVISVSAGRDHSVVPQPQSTAHGERSIRIRPCFPPAHLPWGARGHVSTEILYPFYPLLHR